jgi:hypothetical protein
MVREWNEWNAAMLPEMKESATGNWAGADVADHYGALKVSDDDVDDVSVWPDRAAAGK